MRDSTGMIVSITLLIGAVLLCLVVAAHTKPIPVEAPAKVEAPSMLPYDDPKAYRIIPLSVEGLKCVVVLGPVSGIGGCWPEMAEMEEGL